MANTMMLMPDTLEEFMEQNKVVDTEQIYTNGTELVPIFRIKQWFISHPCESPRWIPVTERLPEVGSEVLVCYDFKGRRSVYISNFYGDGEFHGLDDEYLTNEGRRYRKAVAWMPLPTPYKGGEEE